MEYTTEKVGFNTFWAIGKKDAIHNFWMLIITLIMHLNRYNEAPQMVKICIETFKV